MALPPSPPAPASGPARQPAPSRSAAAAELSPEMREAIDRCRRGNWKEGLPQLARLAEEGDRQEGRPLPALVYSYLGYGIALRQQRIQEGLKLCQHAVKLEFFQADGYLNLARTLLLAGQRRNAVRAIAGGLKVEPDHGELRRLQRDIGVRRSPVLPFLSRDNWMNQLLGKLRHILRPAPGKGVQKD